MPLVSPRLNDPSRRKFYTRVLFASLGAFWNQRR